jgi:hypothetical protein
MVGTNPAVEAGWLPVSLRYARNVPGVNGTLTRNASFSTLPTVSSRNRRVKSPQGSLLAVYRYLSRRFSLVKSCTQDRNRCRPSKLMLPSAATSSSFLFSRA